MDETSGAASVATLSEAAAIHRDLIRIGRAIRARSDAGPLSPGQLSALWTIAQNAPIRATELATRESVAGPTMSRVVACLEQSGMVTRTTDPHDGRVSLLTPTATGYQFMRGATSRKSDLFAEALDLLEPADRIAVTRSMRLLADTVCELDHPSTAPHTAEEGA
ncbi:MarR family transcriptional regulator [Gordonia sp. N1V]|uniref:MarR family winged helix-turn-helix transcriptional regulator n=1 Tax=Gordonia sp. N1V TaxID=3034163 RepID=UPI0023E1FA5F|nr:MarR family transcriptional regulator [Gordonia sp. N1V]MDF3281059.1 MarR family transcriptional regulator [Gordonia sp. N1V]